MTNISPLDALGDPTRRKLFEYLRLGPSSVTELISIVPISQPAVSQHLRVLRESGLVDVRTDAQRRVYRLRTEPLEEVDAWLEPYRKRWMDRFDRLERHLETLQQTSAKETP